MSQWFRGRIEGYYVGTGATGPFVSQFGTAARYKMRVYRALIEEIEVLDSEESLSGDEDKGLSGHSPFGHTEGSFYQSEIEDVRLLGVRPQRCFEGSVYDVAIQNMKISHSTKKGNKTYGRVIGEVVGRYLLPPEPEDSHAPEGPNEVPLALADEEVDPRTERAIEVQRGPERKRAVDKAERDRVKAMRSHDAAPKSSRGRDSERSRKRESGDKTRDDKTRDIEPLHPPSTKDSSDEMPSNVPIPLLGFLVAIILGLTGGFMPALLWVGVLFPILMIRVMLSGQFKVSFGQRVFGAVLGLINLSCLGWLGLDWWTLGHLSINIAALSGLALTVLVSSVLPSPGALLMTGGGLAVVLFLWFGPVDTRAPESLSDKAEAAEVDPSGAPSVRSPGKSRTNKDGSWPFRSQ